MKKAAWLLLLLAFQFSVSAQEESGDRKGKFFLIPEIWISFGSVTYIDIAPMVGYHVLDRLAIGLGPHYIYQSTNYNSSVPYDNSTHAFGIKGFGRFALITNAEEFLPVNLFSDLFVHAEYEWLSLEESYYVPPYTGEGRYHYRGILVGGGFSQRVGINSSVSFTVLWDVNSMTVSPYSNPVFRVGFNTFF